VINGVYSKSANSSGALRLRRGAGLAWLSVWLLVAGVATTGCAHRVEPFGLSRIDRTTGPSRCPLAVDPARVGTYPGHTKSGAGYFYDEVLEYRVWLHPEKGARPLAGDQDYFAAFARYETALAFSREEPGAEEPLALVLQREHVNEPTPGTFEWVRTPRITEWQVAWLQKDKRQSDSIANFLAAHRARP
jgi:hypothetical protein